MLIRRVDAYAIRMPAEGTPAPSPERRDLDADHFIDRHRWTSIYSRRHETCLVRIEAEDGTVGWGEAQAPVSPRTVVAIIEDLCAPMLVGQNPGDTEYLWYRLYSAMRERGHATGFYVDALAGTDLALFDLLGKMRNLPAHRLIGGRFRDEILVYAGIGGAEPGQAKEAAQRHIEAGYRALKLHLRQPNRELLSIVGAVREAIGSDIELLVDVHGTRDASEAIALGRGLEELGVRWLEAPTLAEDIRGHATVAAALDLQIATGEWLRTAWEWRWWIEAGAFDVAMPDIARTGLTEGKRIAGLCDIHNLPIAPHVGGGGILSVAASVQFSAAIPNFQILEHSHGAHEKKGQVARSYPVPRDGVFAVDDTPGLGVDIDEEAVRRLSE
ncbi:MAG: mandelate racemase/muconate lactonizing enzyme family protein [Gemmatimonadetes bacterium]|nr:mandelate racemase/muconate lactonizing enzyme family protein [Gemmatimonadota bacterium]